MNQASLQWFSLTLHRYPWTSGVIVIVSIMVSLAEGLSVSLLIPFLTSLFDPGHAVAAQLGVLGTIFATVSRFAGPGNELAAISATIIFLVVFRCVLTHYKIIVTNTIAGEISCTIRGRMHENLMYADYAYISAKDDSRLLNTLDAEAWKVTDAISSFFEMISGLCMVLVFAAILFMISWELTLIAALCFILVSLSMTFFNRHLSKIGKSLVQYDEAVYARASELIDGMRMIRAYGREQTMHEIYDEASRNLFRSAIRVDRVASYAANVQEIFFAVIVIVMIFIGLHIGVASASLIAFLALLYRMQPFLKIIDESRMFFATLKTSVERVSEILNLSHWNANNDCALIPQRPCHSIQFQDVSFSYGTNDEPSRAALQKVSLQFPIGEMTAVVGWSGAGKSTLINLLMRFYDPVSGGICVDGTPLRQIDLRWWRQQLAIAGQDADLIDGSIFENIAFGCEGATMDDVVEAARKARIHDFIASLPEGYETRTGRRGVLLSGGQRQRIGLARALIRKDGILILDEATNSLDSMTETEILETLEELRGHVTIIVIAHRLSTTRSADQVIVLSSGQVAEVGTPASLYQKNGVYTKMVQLQAMAIDHDTHDFVPRQKAGGVA